MSNRLYFCNFFKFFDIFEDPVVEFLEKKEKGFLEIIEEKIKKEKNIHVIWHITNKCNLFCKYCFTNSSPFEKNPENFHEILGKACEIIRNSNKNIILSVIGGEPLLIGNLNKILSEIRNKVESINIDTNLTLLNEEIYDKLKGKIDYWNTTLDSYRKEINDYLRGGFEKVVNNIKFLKEQGEKVNVNIVITRINLKDLYKTVEFLVNLNVDRITISKVVPIGRALENINLLLNKDDLIELRKIYNEILKEFGNTCKINLINVCYKRRSHTGSCYCGVLRVTIDWFGNIHPCELMAGNPSKVNVFNIEKVEDSIFKFRRFWLVSLSIPFVCENCEFKEKCSKRCKFLTYILTGTFLTKPTFCDLCKASEYDVFSYRPFSPLFPEGKSRYKGFLAKCFEELISKDFFSEGNILELGCGAGVWLYFLEKRLNKKCFGIEKNRIMVFLFNILKEREKLKSEVFLDDILSFNIEKVKDYNIKYVLAIDNLFSYFSLDTIEKIIKKYNFSKYFIVEMYGEGMKKEVEEYTYNFYGKKIFERKIALDNNKKVFRKYITDFVYKAEFTQYYHEKEELEEIFERNNYVKIYEKQRKSRYLIIFEKVK